MFRVNADTLDSYLDFDPIRKIDLQKLDKLLRKSAPGLKRYFHNGTPAGEPGMRFKMIGYEKSHYLAKVWPKSRVAGSRCGTAKKLYSVYLSVTRDGAPLVQSFAGRMGELRMCQNNFSFERFEDLDVSAVAAMFAEADQIFSAARRG